MVIARPTLSRGGRLIKVTRDLFDSRLVFVSGYGGLVSSWLRLEVYVGKVNLVAYLDDILALMGRHDTLILNQCSVSGI